MASLNRFLRVDVQVKGIIPGTVVQPTLPVDALLGELVRFYQNNGLGAQMSRHLNFTMPSKDYFSWPN